MKFLPGDLKKLQISLLVCLLMIVMGAALVFFANGATRSAQRERVTAQAQRNDYVGKLQRVSSEESEIKEKSALFQRLQKRGIIGEEQRLDWVELIKEIRDTRKLLDLQYEFSPQQSLEKGSAGGYAFKSSAMRLQMKLLHENDLLNFVNDLRSKAKAYVRVRSCNLTRIPRSTAASGETALLGADCELEWITILPAKGAT